MENLVIEYQLAPMPYCPYIHYTQFARSVRLIYGILVSTPPQPLSSHVLRSRLTYHSCRCCCCCCSRPCPCCRCCCCSCLATACAMLGVCGSVCRAGRRRGGPDSVHSVECGVWRRAKLKVPKAHKSDALSAFPGTEKKLHSSLEEEDETVAAAAG